MTLSRRLWRSACSTATARSCSKTRPTPLHGSRTPWRRATRCSAPRTYRPSFRRWLRVGLWGLIGLVIGAAPIWIYNLQTGGATLRFVFSGARGQTADRLAVLSAWWNNDLPRGAGLWHPWGPGSLPLAVTLASF